MPPISIQLTVFGGDPPAQAMRADARRPKLHKSDSTVSIRIFIVTSSRVAERTRHASARGRGASRLFAPGCCRRPASAPVVRRDPRAGARAARLLRGFTDTWNLPRPIEDRRRLGLRPVPSHHQMKAGGRREPVGLVVRSRGVVLDVEDRAVGVRPQRVALAQIVAAERVVNEEVVGVVRPGGSRAPSATSASAS